MSYKYQVGGAYKSRNTDEIDKLRQKYLDKGDFSYDPNKDKAYQEYANMMRNQGSLTMEDTIAKASAATGGYASSAAQIAGQQVYNDYVKEIGAAQGDFYDRAFNRFITEKGLIRDDINMLENRESADRAAWEEDYLNAYNEAMASGNKQKVADILGMSLEDYEDSLMNSGTALGDEQLKGYLDAIMNEGTEGGRMYYGRLLDSGYNVGDIYNAANAYSAANGLGITLDGEGKVTYAGKSDADINADIRGLDNTKEGQNFHVQMHDKEHGSKDNLDVQIGTAVDSSSSVGLYNSAKNAGKGLLAYGNNIYYFDGHTVYTVKEQLGKGDEYDDLLAYLKGDKKRTPKNA